MATAKKYGLPEIDLEGAGLQVIELFTFTQELADALNERAKQVRELKAELKRLKKAKQRELRMQK
jgi:hypothetical protein